MKRRAKKRYLGSLVVHVGMFACVSLATPLIAAAQSNPVGGSAVGTGAVGGTVYCADTKQPARFATVRVQLLSSIGTNPTSTGQTPPDAAMAVTDLDGAFFIDRLSPGEYVVLPSLRGYIYPLAGFSWKELTVDSTSPAEPVRQRLSKALPHVTIEAGHTSTLMLSLERGAEIAGTVTYDDGSPTIGAHITISRFSESTHKWETIEASRPTASLRVGWLASSAESMS